MTRADLALAIFDNLRREKTPPLTRYAIMAALARAGETGASTAEVAASLGEQSAYMASGVDRLLDAGLATQVPSHDGKRRVALTPAGLKEFAALITPRESVPA